MVGCTSTPAPKRTDQACVGVRAPLGYSTLSIEELNGDSEADIIHRNGFVHFLASEHQGIFGSSRYYFSGIESPPLLAGELRNAATSVLLAENMFRANIKSRYSPQNRIVQTTGMEREGTHHSPHEYRGGCVAGIGGGDPREYTLVDYNKLTPESKVDAIINIDGTAFIPQDISMTGAHIEYKGIERGGLSMNLAQYDSANQVFHADRRLRDLIEEEWGVSKTSEEPW